MGTGYRLINNEEWMLVANLIAVNPKNWSSGEVGNGMLNRGHTNGGAVLIASLDDNDACIGIAVDPAAS